MVDLAANGRGRNEVDLANPPKPTRGVLARIGDEGVEGRRRWVRTQEAKDILAAAIIAAAVLLLPDFGRRRCPPPLASGFSTGWGRKGPSVRAAAHRPAGSHGLIHFFFSIGLS